MPSIIPTPPARPAVPPTTEIIFVTTNPTVAAGTTYLAENIDSLFRGTADYLTLTNNGSIWLDNALGLFTGYRTSLINTGSIYLGINNGLGLLPQAGAVLVGSDYWTLHNTGSIWVVSQTNGFAAIYGDIAASVYNSGLIAVQSVTGNATGINSYNSGHLLNTATGQLLVEGADRAIAFYSGASGDSSTTQPLVNNAGLIEANATAVGGLSIGIYASHSGGNVATIINSGTIRADYAVLGANNTTTQQAQGPIERIFNLSGGLIDGNFFLDSGSDIVENAGTIIGFVAMGEGEDTVTNTGLIDGIVDMGWDNDAFSGSGQTDKVIGGRGDDVLGGGGGNDLLLGGFGNDAITGGAGNDGLIGEWGNDTITTSGGDYIEGGNGDDRIVLGDYTFAVALGGTGFDTLVLAAGARDFDTGQMGAGTRIDGIEAFEIQTGQNLTLRYLDLFKLLDGGSTFRVVAAAGNTVNLDGAWLRGSDVTIGGTVYEAWSLNGLTVQITEAATVNANTGTAFGGFDAVAAGAAALQPGAAAGLNYTSAASYFAGYELGRDLVIDAEEIFWTDGEDPVFFAQATDSITNHGLIDSVNEFSQRATGLSVSNFINVTNTGRILVDAVGTAALDQVIGDRAWGVAGNLGSLTNSGLISVYNRLGHVTAVQWSGTINNSGQIEALAPDGLAIGIDKATGNDGSGFQRFFNSGSIYALGATLFFPDTPFNQDPVRAAAIGLRVNGGDVTNNGSIVAELVSGADPSLLSYGIWLWQFDNWAGNQVTNHGTISADIAIRFFDGNFTQGSFKSFAVTNNGLINGAIIFNGGTDTYLNTNGQTNGLVDGRGGNDSLTGGAFADWLEGGDGDDLINGAGGIDRAYYTAASAGVTVDLRIAGAQNTGGAGTDTLSSIEGLVGSAHNDVLTGTAAANYLAGGGGDDIFYALGGDDTIEGGTGIGDEVRFSGNRADYLIEVSVVNGINQYRVTGLGTAAGDGVDLISTVEFLQFADQRISIGNNRPVVNSALLPDIEIGDSNPFSYQLPAGAFSDVDPDDTLTYSVTTIEGYALPEWITFDSATRTFTGTPPANWVHNWLQLRVTATDNDPGDPGSSVSDVFTFVVVVGRGPDIVGTEGDDNLVGTTRGERLLGLGGNDTFNGWYEADVLDGGDGFDIADYSQGAFLNVNLELNTASGYLADGDTFISIEGVRGSFAHDTITGSNGDNTLWGESGNDFLYGRGGNDLLLGGDGDDWIDGGDGNDRLIGGFGSDSLFGGAGDDRFEFGLDGTVTLVDGGTGFDTLVIGATIDGITTLAGIEAVELIGGETLSLSGAQFASGLAQNTVVSGSGALVVNMTAGTAFIGRLFSFTGSGVSVTVNGTTGIDVIALGNNGQTVASGDGSDQIKGGAGADVIDGGASGDKIIGNGGADILTGGGGNDVFKFRNASDSGVGAAADRITDFAIGGDRLNFFNIDTNPALVGDQGFAFIGNAVFGATGAAQLRFMDSGADLLVQADINGDGVADMEIVLQGLAGQAMTAADFVL